ncbi:calcium-activated chloride channel regulator 1-like [Branchiostoma floridae]|uniref:Calcium-activated chloride channel regulator 1-like n=1 Tax=Branchiostoma floridae TaxID=7739 RepID=A0A9J7M1Q3_BRAFL|nr:calcium-activated chloride channel regulator 1-like [Branchiostoma floridae]
MAGKHCLLLLALVWCSHAVFNRPYEIKLQNNEYTDVLVAIHKDIPEDPRIIDRLKEIFTEASQHLYVATNNRTYIKEVKILIPNTWSKTSEYLPAGTETFERANIRVDVPNPLYEDNPYVQQKGGCGEAGDYMHLTPKYVVDKEYGEYNWGSYGKTIVHEWAHLRWGLFDEYGFDDPLGGSYPHFYVSTSMGIQPVRCSAYTAGASQHAVTGNRCQVDPATGLPEDDCRFYPHFSENRATGSYMFMQFLATVTSFCHSDPEGDPLSYHNREAPNKHNSVCGGQSAWDVMNKHEDFAGGANPPRAVNSTDPNFILLQKSDFFRIVLVLDVSGSMDGEPILLLSQVATRFIRNTVSFGSSVGVVTFSSTASIRHPVVSVNSDAVRNDLIAAIPTSARGGTCIGCGLRKGIEALEATGPPQGGVILLITDGEETDSPHISDVIPELLRKEIIVDTVAISQNADAKLESLAEETGGLSFFSGNGDSIALDNAFTATFEETGESTGVNLLSEEQTISGRQTYANHLYVDNSVGENTTFSFSWLDGLRPTVRMVTPLDLVITEGHSMYDVTSDTITIEIPATATPGKWTYNITNNGPDNQDITIIATSNPVKDNEPIKVTAQVSTVSLDYSSSQLAAQKIYAPVRRGYLPVIGAVVKVLITKPPDGQVEEITLLDNGAGADAVKNDGIYSRYFFNFTADGRYGVSVMADNTKGEAEYIVINRARSNGALPMNPGTGYINGGNVHREPLEQFQRMTTGGVFEVQGVPSGGVNTDMLPPSRVDDLKVMEVSYASSSVMLSWTALGDDFDQGGPAHYFEVRYGRHFGQLADNFHGSASINHSQVLQGSLTSPPEPGSAQTIVILVPDRGDNVTFVFAVRMCDEADNCGDPSNIVSANLEYIPEPEIFTEASRDLYVATNNRTFFKEVKILIPNTWTKKPEYLPAGTKTFERANVR